MNESKADPTCEECRGSGIREVNFVDRNEVEHDEQRVCWCVDMAESEKAAIARAVSE